jgi:uncharacterized protein (TIGR02217 family)
MKTFEEIRFPEDISYGSSGGPEYSTDVVITASGHEQRNINWQQARARYNVAHGIKTEKQLAQLISFFRARKGRAIGFRFKDWSDFTAQSQLLGKGDSNTTSFQLIKTYESGSRAETRIITKPVKHSVKIMVDDNKITTRTIDYKTGIVTFTTPPKEGAIITASFEFDVPVRFDTDRLSSSLDSYGVYSWLDIPLIEVRI